MAHKIELIGKYRTGPQISRFYIKSANVNDKPISAVKMDYTKTEFMGLISPIWERVIMTGAEIKIVLTVEKLEQNG